MGYPSQNKSHIDPKTLNLDSTFLVSSRESKYTIGSMLASLAIIFFLTFIYTVVLEQFEVAIDDGSMGTLVFLSGFAVLLISFYAVFKFLHNDRFKNLITLNRKLSARRFLFGFLIFSVCSAIVELIYFSIVNESLILRRAFNAEFLKLFLVGIPVFFFQTFFEELFFRSYLNRIFFRYTKSVYLTIIMSSFCFSLLHYGNNSVSYTGGLLLVQIFLIGLFLSVITIKQNGIEEAVGIHFANNLVFFMIMSDARETILDISLFTFRTDVLYDLLALPVILIFYLFLRKLLTSYGFL